MDANSTISSPSHGLSLSYTQSKYQDLKELGVVVVGSDLPDGWRSPLIDTITDEQLILGVPAAAFVTAFKTCTDDKYSQEIRDGREGAYFDIPRSFNGKSLTEHDRQVLYAAVYTYRLFVWIENNPTDEGALSGLFKDLLNELKFDSRVTIACTTTNASQDLVHDFCAGASRNLTAVKPDISVGYSYRDGAINFRRDDPSIKVKDIGLYLRSRGDIYYNMPMALTLPLFPPLAIEIKSETGVSTNLQSQVRTCMFYDTKIWDHLGRRAAAADPAYYAAHRPKVDMRVTYGLALHGAAWKLLMMTCDDSDSSSSRFPIYIVAQGSFSFSHDVVRFFNLWGQIMAETEDRLDHLGVCLHCLRDQPPTSAQPRDNTAGGADPDHDDRAGEGDGSGPPGEGGDGAGGNNDGRRHGDSGGQQGGRGERTTRSCSASQGRSTRQRPSWGGAAPQDADDDDRHLEHMICAWRSGFNSSGTEGGISCA